MFVMQDATANGDGVHRVEKPVLPGALTEEGIQLERLQKELRTVAALEVSVSVYQQAEHCRLSLHRDCMLSCHVSDGLRDSSDVRESWMRCTICMTKLVALLVARLVMMSLLQAGPSQSKRAS